MSLLRDVTFMLQRSTTASKLKVARTLESFRKSLKKHPEHLVYQNFPEKVKYNLCCARILQGDYSQWDGWQYRDEWAATMRYGIKSIPFWNGEPTDNLIIIAEQGIGDEVLFSSLIPEAMIRCKKVTYACDERLIEIINRSFGIKAKKRYVDARDDILASHTAYIPAGDLLPLFRRRLGDFPKKPFLKVNKERVKEFEKYRGRTGLSWRGRHGELDPIELKIENPLSLQYDYQHEMIEVPDIDGMVQLDLKNDIEGVIALISVLDRVVCVPTSVMHFAGAVGTTCEIILPDKKTELTIDGVVDELDWHVPEGKSHAYSNSTVYRNIEQWLRK